MSPGEDGGRCEKRSLFRWLLRKSKSSRTAKEMATAQTQHRTVTTSKSCDTGLTVQPLVSGGERWPTAHLLWKLLPPPAARQREQLPPFRASFSCSDVHGLDSKQTLSNSQSSREINSSHPVPQGPMRGLLSKSSASRLDGHSEEACLHSSHCKLCLVKVPVPVMYILQDCGCSFCLPCLRQYLLISIREGRVPVTCPDASCPSRGTILIPEIKDIAGEDAMFMFQRYKLNLDVALDPGRMWCPSPGCETICAVQPTPQPQLVRCHNCRLKFCSECKLQWHGKTTSCSDAIELESCVKRCPSCRVPIEKEDGCAQMMCYRCRHVFCWHCMASLDDDFLLRHYDKGPCRNKLGHSRASIVWHRTQVVGIFAGFSLLLLLASPFLLLAAPCLLCCRGGHKGGLPPAPL